MNSVNLIVFFLASMQSLRDSLANEASVETLRMRLDDIASLMQYCESCALSSTRFLNTDHF